MTTTVNHPPVVTIHGPASLFYGQNATFTAERSDPDEDAIALSWSWKAGACPGSLASTDWPELPPVAQESFTLSADSLQKGAVCLWAFARDAHGATAVAHVDVTPQDRPPQPTLHVVTPAAPAPANDLYPLYTAFALSAEAPAGTLDPDGDTVNLSWQLTGPAGSKASLVPCKAMPSTDLRRCFQADVPGRYLVSLKAREAIGTRGEPLETTVSVAVNAAPDALPCLRETDPPIDATTLPLSVAPGGISKPFWVKSVVDDGDPFPKSQDADSLQGEPDFRWYLTDAQGHTSVYPTSSAVYLMPTAFRLGDEVTVRLEIRDRDLAKMTAAFAACGDSPVCPPQPTSNCLQRVTWTVRFNLPEGS